MAEYRLPEHKYTEAEYLFQTIEMTKSEEELGIRTPAERLDLIDCVQNCLQESPSIYSWKVVKGRHRRRNTISHTNGAPPAPPSTPTSLTATATPTPSPTATLSTNSIVAVAAATAAAAEVDERINNFLYKLDYVPKYKKKLKEQQRTDAELASLLDVITLSSSSSSTGAAGLGGGGGGGIRWSSSTSGGITKTLPPLEHRICATSRTIRKPAASTKIFKIHRNAKRFFREPEHEDDSVSAPEYDDAEEREIFTTSYRRQLRRRFVYTPSLRKQPFVRFEQQEGMEAMVHDFGSAMTFNEV